MSIRGTIDRFKAFSHGDLALYQGTVRRNLAVLMLLGFVLRLVAAQGLSGGLTKEYEGDEVGYVTLAGHLVHDWTFTDYHGFPTAYRTPGLPLLLALPVGIAGTAPLLLRMFMCLVGSLLIPACYLLARSATGSAKMAWTSAALAVVFPAWVILSSSVGSDIPSAVLIAVMAWLLIEGRQRSLVWMVGAGIVWGAATLIRPVSLVYAPGIILWVLIALPQGKSRLATLMAVMVPYVCLLTPWTIQKQSC